ncbi:MAG: hypothetical protein JNJ99_13470 [Crocinitomicaceae bacterium]|nr:hypothetical protein [Crocinitomicaceae bacterium]
MGKFQDVIIQIDLFIRKYYKNQMIKGFILFVCVLLLTYFTVSALEYFGRFGSMTRFMLLVVFVGVNGFLFFKYLLFPLLKLSKLGKNMSIWEAADKIGGFFPEIGDKLKNTLQLERDLNSAGSLNLELVRASIEQRSMRLSVVPFSTAIDLNENKRYLKYVLPIIIGFIVVAIINPGLFLEGSNRVINFNEEFVAPAPFEFVLASENQVKEGDDYLLEINIEGNELPDEVRIVSTNGTYNLNKKSKTSFFYQFTNITSDLSFYCEANGFKSDNFLVDVLYKPVIEDISMNVVYPKHTGLKSTRFDNTGDISVPEGSTIEWLIRAKNLSELNVSFLDTSISLKTNLTNSYSFKRKFYQSENYFLITNSPEVRGADSLNYSVSVVKDEFPQISIEETVDSMNSLKRFVQGEIADDYGFRGLSATMKIVGKDTSYSVKSGIKINPNTTAQLFSFYIDLSGFNLKPGDRIEYSFTVTDNDEVNGYKSSSTGKNVFEIPSLDELENDLANKSENLESEMDKALKDAEELKKEIHDMKNEVMNKQNLDWKDKQSIENLLNMQKDLNERIEKMQMENEKLNNERENFLEEDPELEEKRAQLEKLMEELMDEELLELFKELEELLNEMNKDDLLKSLDQLEQKSENLNEELDRTLELFKMMEINEKLSSLEEQLKELAEQQEELMEMTENKELSPEELSEKQEELNKKFDEIQKDMDEIEEKNQQLQNPMDINFDQQMEEQIDQEMNDSKENLDNGNEKKSGENQSKAADMMKQMAENIQAMQMQMAAQQQSEDMDALRYLLENIVALSHRQEALMGQFKTTSPTDPKYNELAREQLEIQSASQVVNDSLVALSKRVFQLSSFINESLAELNYNLDKSLHMAEERKSSETMQSQQYVMTDYNDLALMLSEVLDQMQQQAQSQMQGSGTCNNPGGSGKGSTGGMTMEQMKKSLEEQIKKMQGGPNPGGEKKGQGDGMTPGDGQGNIPGLSNKEVVKMAAEQERIREGLKQMREDLNKDGSGAGNGLNDLIEDIDQLEKDLLNGNIGSDFIRRQQDILTRLLEHEKAMRERGYSDERESNEGKNPANSNLIEFTEYNRKKNAEAEFLRSLPVGLRVYYKTLVNEYFNSVNN